MSNIRKYLTQQNVIRAECEFCDENIQTTAGDAFDAEFYSIEGIAETYEGEGWKEIIDKKFEKVGLACPTCAKALEKDER